MLNAGLLLTVDVLKNVGNAFIAWKRLSKGYAVFLHANAHNPVALSALRHHFDVMILPLSTISLYIVEARKKSLAKRCISKRSMMKVLTAAVVAPSLSTVLFNFLKSLISECLV